MFTARTKIRKDKGAQPTEFEDQIAQLLFDIQSNQHSEIASNVKELYITAAREVDLGQDRKAVLIFVPVPLLKEFQKIHSALIDELEKKLSGKSVFIVAQRRILPVKSKVPRQSQQRRPRSRTLTSVHDAILEDICYPVDIVGKRTRVKVDGKKSYKVFLDPKQEKTVESRADIIPSVYKKLTGKNIEVLFPVLSVERD